MNEKKGWRKENEEAYVLLLFFLAIFHNERMLNLSGGVHSNMVQCFVALAAVAFFFLVMYVLS